MIHRLLTDIIARTTKPGFVHVIYGPRRVGKTVLLEQLRDVYRAKRIVSFNGDTEETRTALGTTSEVKLRKLVESADTLFIDEAQRIPNIGLSLKILTDAFPEKTIVVTGSSSLDLVRGMREHLTGRNMTHNLYPLSTKELGGHLDRYKIPSLLDDQLLYGGYPYIQHCATASEKQDYLQSLIDDYLFRDIVWLERIENPDTLRKLTTLLAFQIGHEVSLNELSRSLGIDVKTVARYIALLEKGFIIFSVGAFAKNRRNEVTKSKKYYFYDVGIRNALTRQFLSLDQRTDVGQLWENFIFVERMKKQAYAERRAVHAFWRTYQGAEIDMLEEVDGKLDAFEFKWGKGMDTIRTPKAFFDAYKTTLTLINPNNYLEFLLDEN